MEKRIWGIAFVMVLFLWMGATAFSQDSIRGVKIQGTFRIAANQSAPETDPNSSEVSSDESSNTPETPTSPLFQFDTPPKALNLDSIFSWMEYPPAAESQQLEGRVVAEIVVSEKGRYLEHKIKQTDHPLFTAAVEKQIKKLRFSPAKNKLEPVIGKTTITFPFRLHR